MANRLIMGAALSLALIFSPGLASPVPSKAVRKKSSRTSTKIRKKSRKPKRPRRSQMLTFGQERRARRSYISETPPLMRVVPQRDGRFMLEPLRPKKPSTPAYRSHLQKDSRRAPSSPGRYHKFEPWNFSELVLAQARQYCGVRYSRGASLAYSSATDCSGFVQYIYQGFKIDLPRSSAEQAQVGKVVTRHMDFSKLLPGDLLFFRRRGRYIGHAGIYLGEGKMIHASSHRHGVIITDLRQPYYEGTFVVAKRVFEVEYPE